MQKIRILNLGAGVQSTTLALMAMTGEIETFDYAVFADVQAEPKHVYIHLDWLIKEVDFPVLIRTKGSLIDNLVNGADESGGRFSSIPAFAGDYKKPSGIVRRQCTKDYKVDVVERTIKRDILNLEKYARIPKGVLINQSFGLSYDEVSRVLKVQKNFTKEQWTASFPLFDIEMTRSDCEKWLKDYGIPHTVPRSACTFCPYHSNAEWRRMKAEDPESWKQALEVDKLLRDSSSRCNQGLDLKLWLHRSCMPLDEIDFESNNKDLPGQTKLGFMSECEGMCGV